MKRTAWKKKPTKPMRKTPLRRKGKSETTKLKDEIQSWLREIVMIRDGGCILSPYQGQVVAGVIVPKCNGYRPSDGALVLQADHLITRGNSATYSDERLVVCVCRGHHGWKSVGSNMRKAMYDKILKAILPKERVELWEVCEADTSSHRMGAYDWKLAIAALKQTYERLKAEWTT
jgi:hypothetical protein